MRKIKIELFVYPSLFYFISVILPLLIVYQNQNSTNLFFELLSIIAFFISPFLFFIPYKLIKEKTKKEKFLLIIFGFIIPYIILYLYLIFGLKNALSHVVWG